MNIGINSRVYIGGAIVMVLVITLALVYKYHIRESVENTNDSTFIGQNKYLTDVSGKVVGIASKYETDIPGQRLIIKAVVTLPDAGKKYTAFYTIGDEKKEVLIGKMIDTGDGKFVIEYKSDDSIQKSMMVIIKSENSVLGTTEFL
jgi:hypothetical protein